MAKAKSRKSKTKGKKKGTTARKRTAAPAKKKAAAKKRTATRRPAAKKKAPARKRTATKRPAAAKAPAKKKKAKKRAKAPVGKKTFLAGMDRLEAALGKISAPKRRKTKKKPAAAKPAAKPAKKPAKKPKTKPAAKPRPKTKPAKKPAKKPAAKKSAGKRRGWSRKSLEALVASQMKPAKKKPGKKKKSASKKKPSAKKLSPSAARREQLALVAGRAPSGKKPVMGARSLRSLAGLGPQLGERWDENPRRRRGGLLANFTPAASGLMRYLPTRYVALEMAKQAGIGAVGLAGGITFGRLFASNSLVQRTLVPHTGAWTAVLGNVIGVGVLYGVGQIPAVDRRIGGFMPWLLGGAALAAVVNGLTALVSRGTIPANVAQWVAPWAPVASATVASANGVPAEDVASGFGQIDVYERAMSGMGNAEAALQYEMSKLAGGGSCGNDGIFEGGRNVFGEYQETYPWSTSAEQGVAAYESTPVGAEVEEAFAAYESTPMGTNVMEATAGLGANVMEATAGLGDARAILTDIAASTRQIVQRRRAQGLPVDAAFTKRVAQAAATVAKSRMAGSRAATGVQAAAALPRMSSAAPGLYGKVVGKPVAAHGGAGVPEAIEGEGIFAGEGVFAGEGIFG